MNKNLLPITVGFVAVLVSGCGSSDDGVTPLQVNNPPLTEDHVKQMSKPDPKLTAVQNQEKSQMAQDELRRNQYYMERFKNSKGGQKVRSF